MKPKVYLETSVISYLIGRISRDSVTASNQRQTRAWWEESRSKFDLRVSQLVLLEIGGGDLAMARQRLALAQEIPRLDFTREGLPLSQRILRETGLPKKAGRDALHIALAALYEMDLLLTWNCRHIANALLIPKITSIIESRGLRSPLICTPPQLRGY
ncbi:MAG: DNA-binding protein [Acidobacteria bacterium]|nr:MAG: DNA-binding protein [Acidobacteriota bacterium]